MNRRDFLRNSGLAAAGTSAALASTAVAETAPKAKQRPNVILFLSDQFRWDFVGANGANSSTKTPNIDAMAERGVNFTHCVTNQPVCAPSRSVLFTSRYATETEVWHNGPGMKQDLPTLAAEFRKADVRRCRARTQGGMCGNAGAFARRPRSRTGTQQ